MSRRRTMAGRMKKVGYARRDPVSHRPYNFDTAIARYKKTGQFITVGNGSGHQAGENWAKAKGIDPEDENTKYGKNSPSFDEGVYKYKNSKKQAMASKMANI